MLTVQTIQDLCLIYLQRMQMLGGKNLAVKTRHVYSHLIPIIGEVTVQELSAFHIDVLKHRLKEKSYKPATINRILATLSHVLSQSVEWKLILANPCKIRKIKEDNARLVYLTSEQVRDLLKAAQGDPSSYIYLFILIGVYTGMRATEILSIRKEDILFDQQSIHIPKAKAGARVQPMPAPVAKALGELVKLTGPTGWVFPSKDGMTHLKSVRKVFRRVVKYAGLDPDVIVRHTLRHTAISHLVQSGVDLPTVKKISGHKTLAMVERYSHQNDVHVKNALTLLEDKYIV